MKYSLRLFAICAVVVASSATYAQTLVANTTANNGGSSGWGMFMNVSATGTDLNVTSLTTANAGLAGTSFSVEIFTRSGSALGGPVGSGAGSSSAGWTSLGVASATQGAVDNGISLNIDIPDIYVASGQTVGVAMVFTGNGPRYFGTGTPAIQTFTDGVLTLDTGDVRSAPFTTGGSFFSSRGLTGSLTYSAVPEPFSMVGLLAGAALVARRRRK
jgi:hypothetical protein